MSHIIGTHPSGSVYLYHSGPDGECFTLTRVRRDSKATYLTCALHDRVTTIPRDAANADHREVQALIDAGKVTPLVHPDNTPLDPLQAAREDGNTLIPALIPQDTAGRRALRDTLKAAHVDRRPAGSHFQKRVGNVIEVHEDTLGTGATVVRERYRDQPQGLERLP